MTGLSEDPADEAERYRAAYGFERGTDDWRALVDDPKVEAVVIATPQETHRRIAEAAFARQFHATRVEIVAGDNLVHAFLDPSCHVTSSTGREKDLSAHCERGEGAGR